MNRIGKILCLFVVLFLTGCNKYNMDMSINNKRQMDFSLYILSLNEYDFEEKIVEIQNKLGDTFSVNLYSENGYGSGISIFKHYSDIDYVSLAKRTDEFDLLYFYNNGYDFEVESKMFNLDKSVDTNRYVANFYVDLSEVLSTLDDVSVVFNLTVPNGTLSNNANYVSEDGNTLTWNLTNYGKNEIDFVFEITSYDSLYQLGAIIIAIFLVFTIFTKLLSKSGDVHSSKDELVNEYDADIKVANLTNNAIKNKSNSVKQNEGNVNNKSEINNLEKMDSLNPLKNDVSNDKISSNDSSIDDLEWFNVPIINNNVDVLEEKKNVVNNDSNVFNGIVSNNSNNNNNNNNTNTNNVNDNVTFNDISNSLNNNTTEEIIKLNNKDVVINKKKDEE